MLSKTPTTAPSLSGNGAKAVKFASSFNSPAKKDDRKPVKQPLPEFVQLMELYKEAKK